MTGIKYLIFLMTFMSLVATAETVSRFYVTEKRLAGLKKEYGEQAVNRLNSLLALMEKLVASPENTIVTSVNRFFNQIEYSHNIIFNEGSICCC